MAHKRKPKKQQPDKSQDSAAAVGKDRSVAPPPPSLSSGDVMNALFVKRAKARLASMEAVNPAAVKRRLRSGSRKRQGAMVALLEGRVNAPEQLVATARAGGNPLYVAMTRALARRSRRAAKKSSARRRKAATKPAKAATSSSPQQQKKPPSEAFHTKRQALSSPAASASASRRGGGVGGGGGVGVSLALAARFQSIHAAQGGEREQGKSRREAAAAAEEGKAARKAEPQRKRGRTEGATTVVNPGDTRPRWVRRCSAKTIRACHGGAGITKARHLRLFWRARGTASRKERKFALHRVVGRVGGLPPPFRYGNTSRASLRLRVVRAAHKVANADLWGIARDVVQHRQRYVRQMACPDAGRSSSSSCGRRRGNGSRLSLARSFPLFGLVVDILWVRFRRTQRAGNVKAQTCPALVLRRTGVVLTESAGRLSVLLLPKVKDRSQLKSVREYLFPSPAASPPGDTAAGGGAPTLEPRVVSVRKWFPGASGTAAQFRTRVRPRKPRVTSWIVAVAVVRGEHPTAPDGGGHSGILACLHGRCL